MFLRSSSILIAFPSRSAAASTRCFSFRVRASSLSMRAFTKSAGARLPHRRLSSRKASGGCHPSGLVESSCSSMSRSTKPEPARSYSVGRPTTTYSTAILTAIRMPPNTSTKIAKLANVSATTIEKINAIAAALHQEIFASLNQARFSSGCRWTFGFARGLSAGGVATWGSSPIKWPTSCARSSASCCSTVADCSIKLAAPSANSLTRAVVFSCARRSETRPVGRSESRPPEGGSFYALLI